MILKNQKILIVSNEPWSDVWFSKHNYAWELAKNNTVYFVNSPSKWKIKNLFSKNISIKPISNSLSVVDIQNRFPSGFNWMKEVNNFFASKKLRRHLPNYKINEFILWSFTPLFLFRPHLLKLRFSIFHIVDQHWTTFYGSRQLASVANYLLLVSDKITEEYKNFNTVKFVLSHAISDDEFDLDTEKLNQVKSELKEYGNFGIFVGSIDHRIDFKFILRITKECNDRKFVFVGPLNLPENHPYRFLFTCGNNIYCIGKRHYKELKYYINAASFCISPMNFNFPGNNIAHHKTLPYLAQGKKIFSPAFLDYNHFSDVMYMNNNADEMIRDINNFKEDEPEQLKNKRITIAKQSTYSGHLQKIEDFINETHRTDNRQ